MDNSGRSGSDDGVSIRGGGEAMETMRPLLLVSLVGVLLACGHEPVVEPTTPPPIEAPYCLIEELNLKVKAGEAVYVPRLKEMPGWYKEERDKQPVDLHGIDDREECFFESTYMPSEIVFPMKLYVEDADGRIKVVKVRSFRPAPYSSYIYQIPNSEWKERE